MSSDVTTMFKTVEQELCDEQDKREEIRSVVKFLDQISKGALIHLQQLHNDAQSESVEALCKSARSALLSAQEYWNQLKSLIPSDQFYRYIEHFRFCAQRFAFITALIKYLETGTLVTKAEAASMIGISDKKEDGFHLDLEDFLMGLLTLASELSRLAVNCVTLGDYKRPMEIKKFIGDLDGGFRLLNLKNDAVRRRYDVLKYDVKRVEGVIFDLHIRNLLPSQGNVAGKVEQKTE